MKKSAKSESIVTNEDLNSCWEKDNNSTLYLLLMPGHAGRMLGIVGNASDGEDPEGWRRPVLELNPRASSRAQGSTRELQATDCLSDTESYLLFDRECPRPAGPAQMRTGGAALAGRRNAATNHHLREQVGSG